MRSSESDSGGGVGGTASVILNLKDGLDHAGMGYSNPDNNVTTWSQVCAVRTVLRHPHCAERG